MIEARARIPGDCNVRAYALGIARHVALDARRARKRDRLRTALLALRRDDTLDFGHEGGRFVAPRSVDELLALRSRHPAATLLAGGTDIGLWVNKGLRRLDTLIHTGEVAALRAIVPHAGGLRIGAAASLTAAFAALAAVSTACRDTGSGDDTNPIMPLATVTPK